MMMGSPSLWMLALCATCNAFVLPAAARAGTLVARNGLPVCAEKVEVSPVQGVVMGGGFLMVAAGVYCTSTGSPPTGLALGFVALLFMYLGAGVIEGDA
jgi:hypothetical protein